MSRSRCSATRTATSCTSANASVRSSAATRRSSRSRRRRASRPRSVQRSATARCALARHVGYEGAGTVEFLVDADDGGEPTDHVPRGEHPAPGRAPGHRGGHRSRPRRAAAAGRRRRGAADRPGRRHVRRPRDRGPCRRRGPGGGLAAVDRCDHRVRHRRVDGGPSRHRVPGRGRGVVRLRLDARQGDRSRLDTRRGRGRSSRRALRGSQVTGVRTNVDDAGRRSSARPTTSPRDTPTAVPRRAPRRRRQRSGPTATTARAAARRRVRDRAARTARRDQVTGFAPSGWRNLRTQGQRQVWSARRRRDATTSSTPSCGRRGRRSGSARGRNRTRTARCPPDDRRALDGPPARCGRRTDRQVAIEIDGSCADVGRRVAVDGRRRRVVTRPAAPPASLDAGPGRRDSSTTTPRHAGGGPVCPLPGTVIAVHVDGGDAGRRRATC